MTPKTGITATVALLAAAAITTVLAPDRSQRPPRDAAADHPVLERQALHPLRPTGQPQLTTIKVTIAPHTALPWHTHPFPNAVYVLSGTLTLHDQASGKTLVLHQGQATGESVNDVHRGEAGDEPAVLLITYAGTAGVPISVPAKDEKPEF